MQCHDSSDLQQHGIKMIDPDTVYIARDVDLSRISTEGVTLYPNTRISGPETLICSGTTVGSLGPVVLQDVALGEGAEVQRGSAERATLLAGALLGPDAHVRIGTVMEESASTGHAVGLKQTVIGAYASVGSNVNFCDCYLGGGRDAADHSEVGSGFTHFNFTPFGASGDKATASIFGAVPRSVLLNADRVFLGGSGGVVGPVEIGYGVVLAAGGVYRKSYGDGQLVLCETSRARALAMRPGHVPGIHRRLQATRFYVGQLKALSSWYAAVRLSRALDEWEERLLRHALTRLDEGATERLKQGDRLIAGARQVEDESVDAAAIRSWAQWCESLPSFTPSLPPAELVTAAAAAGSHIEWVRSLSQEAAAATVGWLEGVVQETRSMGESA